MNNILMNLRWSDVDRTTDTNIFAELKKDSRWGDVFKDVDVDVLAVQYYCRSMNKYIAPLTRAFLNEGVLTEIGYHKIAKTLYNLYSYKWAKLFDSTKFEYNPIENYDMEERGINDKSVVDYGHIITGERNPNITNAVTYPQRKNMQNLYGYNTGTPSPQAENIETVTGSENTVTTGTDSSSENHSGSDTTTRNYTLTRHGNIGVTTSQQMIESERRLVDYVFYDTVFKDMDAILTLPIY